VPRGSDAQLSALTASSARRPRAAPGVHPHYAGRPTPIDRFTGRSRSGVWDGLTDSRAACPELIEGRSTNRQADVVAGGVPRPRAATNEARRLRPLLALAAIPGAQRDASRRPSSASGPRRRARTGLCGPATTPVARRAAGLRGSRSWRKRPRGAGLVARTARGLSPLLARDAAAPPIRARRRGVSRSRPSRRGRARSAPPTEGRRLDGPQIDVDALPAAASRAPRPRTLRAALARVTRASWRDCWARRWGAAATRATNARPALDGRPGRPGPGCVDAGHRRPRSPGDRRCVREVVQPARGQAGDAAGRCRR
jgi:hypothetical protein